MVDLLPSLVRISGSNSRPDAFGTGFVARREAGWAWVVTCAHVVQNVGGPSGLRVAGVAAEVAALGEGALDLAVLRVPVISTPPLSPVSGENTDGEFRTAGYQRFGKNYLVRPLQGTLSPLRVLEPAEDPSGRVTACDLRVLSDFGFRPGYSGSPVWVDAAGGVVAVVSHQLGEAGERGLAISVNALRQLGAEAEALLQPRASVPEAARPAARSFAAVKETETQRRYSALLEEYEAVSQALNTTLNPVTEVRLKRKLEQIEAELKNL